MSNFSILKTFLLRYCILVLLQFCITEHIFVHLQSYYIFFFFCKKCNPRFSNVKLKKKNYIHSKGNTDKFPTEMFTLSCPERSAVVRIPVPERKLPCIDYWCLCHHFIQCVTHGDEKVGMFTRDIRKLQTQRLIFIDGLNIKYASSFLQYSSGMKQKCLTVD